MSKNWKLKPEAPEEFKTKLPEYSELLLQLLYNREILEQEKIEEFLNPKYESLHSPFLFQDMQKAVERIWQAIEKQEQIFIYGDYDADAVTANAVLQQTFKYLSVDVKSYIPDRFTEGYGLNLEAFEKIKKEGAKLVITVDCGTNSVDVADFCRQNKIDLIITDHHEIIGELPKAFALVNPKNHNDNYPFSEITGVGVAFKLASAILSSEKKVNDYFMVQHARSTQSALGGSRSGHPATYVAGWEKWLLDLVAIGTVADCHELLGENRILVKYGLKVLAKSKWAGLRAIVKSAKLDFDQRPPDTYTLGFILAPRLNAAGRLEHANVALDLLMEQDISTALEKALYLEQVNTRRQQLTERVMSEAREQAEKFKDYKILVLLGEGWPKGVVGLAAGRLVEEYNRPVIVLEKGEEFSTGSARTVGNFDLVELLKVGSEHLVKFGGHQQAAGLTLKTSEYEEFYQKLLKHAEQNLKETYTEQGLELESAITEQDLSMDRLEEIKQLEPFGAGNPKPKLFLPNVEVVSLRIVGNGQKHLQAKFKIGNKQISAIAFRQGYRAENLAIGQTVDLAVELIEDSWNGVSEIKLRVIDIREHQND